MPESESPQPEHWEEDFDRLTNMDLYEKLRWPSEFLFGEDHYPESPYELEPERIKSFIRKLLASQKEQMLEALREIRGRPPLCDRCAYHVCEYQAALSDVEEKWKKL